MAKLWKKLAVIGLSATLVIPAVAFAGCGTHDISVDLSPVEGVDYTYRTYTSVSPSNWNMLNYQDSNDTQIMDYINSYFFEFDYDYDDNGEIVDGGYKVLYSAATAIKDVTSTYAEDWGYDEEQVEDGGYAWEITLRNDLEWDDGTEIKAEDFVYSMKEQLNPKFLHYRADSYYSSSVVLKNAKDYTYQGQSGWFAGDVAYSAYMEDLDASLIFTIGTSSENGGYDGATSSFRDYMGFPDSYAASDVATYLVTYYLTSFTADQILALEGKTFAEIKADETLKTTWDAIIGWWQTDPNEELHFFVSNATFPEIDFDEVGIFAADTYKLVICLENPLYFFKDDGTTLSYRAAYYLSGLPLVKEDLYEQCKVQPATGSTLWDTTYCTSLDTSASWGPYKLTYFQSGKQYILSKNENWYGYSMSENSGLYQTDRILCETISEWNTAWQYFQKGGLDAISIDATIADEYKSSDYAYYTPDTYVGSLQIQSDPDSLSRTNGNILLKYPKFREALSLAIDRADYTASCTTSSIAGYGLMSPIHYYDVENGLIYKDSAASKAAQLKTYGFTLNDDGVWKDRNGTTYTNIEAAYAALTGYDLTYARELLDEVYDEAVAAGDFVAGDSIKLAFVTSTYSESVGRHITYLENAWKTMLEGTKFSQTTLSVSYLERGSGWADDFRGGTGDICLGGWQGANWDPGYLIMAYLDENYMYSTGWDTSAEEMTLFCSWVTDENNPDGTSITMSLTDWWDALNGISGARYNWASGALPEEYRLEIIAGLEEVILGKYYTIPLYYYYSASLIGQKINYKSMEYNDFMSYGGIRYMTYNYTDAEWQAYVKAEGTLNYK